MMTTEEGTTRTLEDPSVWEDSVSVVTRTKNVK